MNDSKWREGYALLSEFGLSFDATIYHHQLEDLADLAADYPDVPVVLCHAGTPPGYAGEYAGLGATQTERKDIDVNWRQSMTRLAELPNVTCKISGLLMPIMGWGFHHGAPRSADVIAEAITPMVDFMIDTFGPDRCMLASNFPVDKVAASWSTLYEAFDSVISDRSAADRTALLAETARAVYRLGK